MKNLFLYTSFLSNARLFLVGTVLSFVAIMVNVGLQLSLEIASVTAVEQGEWIHLLHPLMSSLATGFLEEFLFRVLLLGFLLKRLNNPWIAILICSLVFSLLHLGNSHVTWLALISHFSGGIVYSYAYYRIRSIWLAFGLHFGWNYTQVLLGIPMSGSSFFSLFSTHFHTEDWLSGGLYGFEGGLFSLLSRFLLLLVLLYLFRFSPS